MNEKLKTWLGCAGYIAIAILLYKSCDWYSSYYNKKQHLAYIEKKRNDSIRKEFVKDSLAHDPVYQDSVRRAKAYFKKWEKEEKLIRRSELAGFVIDGDSIYHTSLHDLGITSDGEHSYGFTVYDRPKIVFYTINEIKSRSLVLCDVCEETEYIYYKYLDHEIIDIEDARKYDLIPIDEANDYCSHNR